MCGQNVYKKITSSLLKDTAFSQFLGSALVFLKLNEKV